MFVTVEVSGSWEDTQLFLSMGIHKGEQENHWSRKTFPISGQHVFSSIHQPRATLRSAIRASLFANGKTSRKRRGAWLSTHVHMQLHFINVHVAARHEEHGGSAPSW